MNFLKRLFGRDDKFYDLLEASADEAKNSACILAGLMPFLDDKVAIQASLEALSQSRRKHKRISQEITTQLCRTFVTPLEREDIEALSSGLSRVPKTMEKIVERLLICPLNNHAESMIKQVTMLEQAATIVSVMVHSLRTNPHVEEIEDEYGQLQTLEGDADRFMISLLGELFNGQADAKDALFLKDMYELLEKAIDRCRDAGNVVFQVVLKYS
jgi:uncharacterized protein Yka (UPF0111/DUF47 family)